MAKVVISVSIDHETLKHVDAFAAAAGRSRSDVIEDGLNQMLEGSKGFVQIMADPVISKALMDAFTNPEVVRAFTKGMSDQVNDDQLKLFEASLMQARESATQAMQATRVTPVRKERRKANKRKLVKRKVKK